MAINKDKESLTNHKTSEDLVKKIEELKEDYKKELEPNMYRKILDLLDKYYDHLPLGFYQEILYIMKEEKEKETVESLDFSEDFINVMMKKNKKTEG
jgi:hypothetical protein